MTMTKAEREALDAYMELVEESVIGLKAELKALRAESMRYKGTWAGTGALYRRGDVVTYQGTTWHCNAAESTNEKPGTGSDWTMMAKSDG